MKGLELPISMIVIIAVAVLVLVVVVAYFVGAFGGDTDRIKANNAFNLYCGRVAAVGCPSNAFDLSEPAGYTKSDGSQATIGEVCTKLFGSTADCQSKCCTPRT